MGVALQKGIVKKPGPEYRIKRRIRAFILSAPVRVEIIK
jgi:hypothetical protein